MSAHISFLQATGETLQAAVTKANEELAKVEENADGPLQVINVSYISQFLGHFSETSWVHQLTIFFSVYE